MHTPTSYKRKELSKRETMVKRTFKMAQNRNLCTKERFHDYSRWAKGKSESQIFNHIENNRPIIYEEL